MSHEEAFKMYLQDGPGAVDLSVVRQALRYQAERPSEALRIKRSFEQERWEEEQRDSFVENYVLHGGTETEARKAYEQQAADERARRAASAQDEAHRAAVRRTKGVF
jgi:hypothetical protein